MSVKVLSRLKVLTNMGLPVSQVAQVSQVPAVGGCCSGSWNKGKLEDPSHPVMWSPQWAGDRIQGGGSLTERTSPVIAYAQDRTPSPDSGAGWRPVGGQKPVM